MFIGIIKLLKDKNTNLLLLDILIHFLASQYFVTLIDDIILSAKSQESNQEELLYFHILNILIQGANSIRAFFYNLALFKCKYIIKYLQIK